MLQDNRSTNMQSFISLCCRNGQSVQSKLVTVAAGAASGDFIEYEKGAPGVSVQTAYGIEVEVRPEFQNV